MMTNGGTEILWIFAGTARPPPLVQSLDTFLELADSTTFEACGERW
jgi:hypothetical protein